MTQQSNSEPPASQIIAEFIRNASRDARLASKEEITQIKDLWGDEDPNQIDRILREALESNKDLHELNPAGVPRYYSTLHMTESYARILGGKGNPLRLIAEVVREASAYPRPVPVDAFKEPPFQMTDEEILACLSLLEREEGMEDIRRTTTSIGTVFLFSTLHLDPDHAALLAERLDVGQLIDP